VSLKPVCHRQQQYFGRIHHILQLSCVPPLPLGTRLAPCMRILKRQDYKNPLYCSFPSSCNAKRHALYKHVRAQLFNNRFLVTKTHSQDFRHAYAYNSTATEHCTGCRCSLQNCACVHCVSASHFALQELGKPQYRKLQSLQLTLCAS